MEKKKENVKGREKVVKEKKKETKKVVKKEKSFDTKYLLMGALILVILVCVGLTIHFIAKANKENKELDNTINNIFTDATINNIEIHNAYLTSDNNMSTYVALVKYTGNRNYDINSLDIIFTVNGSEVRENLLSNTTLAFNQEKYISVTFDKDYSNATKVRYEVK